MAQEYQVNWDYRSGFATLQGGTAANLEPDLAELINRDSPGVLSPVAATRALDAPPKHRMVTAAPQKREIDVTDPARKLAEEKGIDLADVEGTGVDGRITKADVEAVE